MLDFFIKYLFGILSLGPPFVAWQLYHLGDTTILYDHSLILNGTTSSVGGYLGEADVITVGGDI